MPNQKIFCSVPWHNTHVYWNGQYGMCCSESHPPPDRTYNLKFHSISDWYNSKPMADFRQRILGDQTLSECSDCYKEESHGHESRRIKENFKVGIFTEQAFDRSYQESEWNEHFTARTTQEPRDWHVDFGNECNLACKMCHPRASSKIAQQHVKWGILETTPTNWTTDPVQWQQFIDNVDSTKEIHRIHVMGGEPMINKRYVEFVQHLVDQGRTNISMSFVSNGTVVNHELIKLLKNFKKVDIEISLESINDNNHYIRQGSNTAQVIDSIRWLGMNTVFQVVLRSVPQLLSVNNYDQYIKWAFDRKLSIQSIPLQRPSYLAINVLPWEIRSSLIERYQQTKDYIASNTNDTKTIATGRDTSRLGSQLIRECDMIVNQLEASAPSNVEALRSMLVDWLMRWDKIYDLDAREYYPEYTKFLEQYGYRI
jgi:sulfatase maturation enzyme AslB (radical SAM superfamily)